VLLQEPWPGRHRVDHEINGLRVGDTDLQQTCGLVGANEHGEVVEVEHSDLR